MKTYSKSTQSKPTILSPYKAPVLTVVGSFVLLLILVRLFSIFNSSSRLRLGLEHVCGPKVQFKVKRRRKVGSMRFAVDEVLIRPSPGQTIKSEAVIEHLERVYHGYVFIRVEQKRGGYDVFQASKKI